MDIPRPKVRPGSPTQAGNPELLPALIEAQRTHGYLSEEVLREISRRLDVPLSVIYGVTEFYTMLYTEPVGRRIVRVCDSATCAVSGAHDVVRAAAEHLGIQPGETTPDGETTLEIVPCLGACDRAPVMLLGDELHTHLTRDRVFAALSGTPLETVPQRVAVAEGTEPILLRHRDVAERHRLEGYLATDGYRGLRKALAEMAPAEVVEDVKTSGLLGRGGAAFPTGLKWQFCAQTEGGQKYVVCNADESEPGTFKDHWLMLHDPFAMLEGMTLAAYAVGATKGYVYIRGEFSAAAQRVQQAIDEARADGYLGDDVLGSTFSFDVEVRRGAGAYICGEETALFESIEGKRGMPRTKPPFPTTDGLFGKPTAINNVETLANVPEIVYNGGEWYRQWGTEEAPGTRLFCLSGHVERPGLYEVPLGYSLHDLIFQLGGGIADGRELQAVVCGGAAGTFLRPEDLDVGLDFDSIREVGGTLGSGAVMVFDDTVNLWEIALNFSHFFAHESCGKCFPCQLGTQRQVELLEDILDGDYSADTAATTLRELGLAMTDASICGLGQTAASTVLSLLNQWGLPKGRT